MRLISQDGMIDVPYEQAIIEYEACERNGEEVFHIIFARTTRNAFSIARYSTEAKALKVMEMLQKQFLDYCCNYHSQSGVFCFPKDEEVEV